MVDTNINNNDIVPGGYPNILYLVGFHPGRYGSARKGGCLDMTYPEKTQGRGLHVRLLGRLCLAAEFPFAGPADPALGTR